MKCNYFLFKFFNYFSNLKKISILRHCENYQCVKREKVCNNQRNCIDSSDEECFSQKAIDKRYRNCL